MVVAQDIALPKSVETLRSLVGNTPLLEITFRYGSSVRKLYAKAEYLNFTGSIKDRMALHILCSAYAEGHLKPGDSIVEATSGNTGIALSAIGTAMGHPVIIYMPDWMSRERVQLIQSYGAKVVLVSREEGGFLGSIRLTEEHRRREANVFLPRQFANAANVRAHALTTGPEIMQQLVSKNMALDAFVAGVGTGGTVMGMAEYLRAAGSKAKIYPVEPAESPTLSTGFKVGSHRIQGISDEFIPDILKLDMIDDVLSVSDGDSILMAQKLASTLGLAVGISSGCNFLAAVMAQGRLPNRSVVATVFSDDNRKYLSTDLMKDEPVKDTYMSPSIELLDFTVIR
ncbi:PLP-dependent cysteine synthase family protein [Granulicella arctica]|nr:cysteine synthase family protein [Granulicella arctica]